MKTIFYYNGLFLCILLLSSCQSETPTEQQVVIANFQETPSTSSPSSPKGTRFYWYDKLQESTPLIGQMPLPEGFVRQPVTKNSFMDWLRHLPLKADGTKVYYYNEEEKYTQSIHEAVIDIDLGRRDLQVSEDVVLRLRTEYLFSKNDFKAIAFPNKKGKTVALLDYTKNKRPSYLEFRRFLEILFAQTSVSSLSEELEFVRLGDMKIGDVFIQGGKTGHAAIVVDMAISDGGQRIFMLAQGLVPAQDVHILKNIDQYDIYGAWYPLNFGTTLYTPEWEFSRNDLKRFL